MSDMMRALYATNSALVRLAIERGRAQRDRNGRG